MPINIGTSRDTLLLPLEFGQGVTDRSVAIVDVPILAFLSIIGTAIPIFRTRRVAPAAADALPTAFPLAGLTYAELIVIRTAVPPFLTRRIAVAAAYALATTFTLIGLRCEHIGPCLLIVVFSGLFRPGGAT
jgi:hypothetical protein